MTTPLGQLGEIRTTERDTVVTLKAGSTLAQFQHAIRSVWGEDVSGAALRLHGTPTGEVVLTGPLV